MYTRALLLYVPDVPFLVVFKISSNVWACIGVTRSSSSRQATRCIDSFVPRPPPFLPSVCVHNNTRERKTGEKWGRPGSVDHVSGCEVDVGGEGPIF